jgi:hypothetical protein
MCWWPAGAWPVSSTSAGSARPDPALDLVGGWHLLGEGPRGVLRDELGCDDLEWERGRAWAYAQAMGLVW